MTRRSGDLPEEGDENFKNQMTVLKQHNLGPGVVLKEPKSQHKLCLFADNLPTDGRDPLRELFELAYKSDKTPTQILQAIQRGDRHYLKVTLAECEDRQGILYYRGRLFVPRSDELRLHLMKTHHDSPAFGHPGWAKTLELIQREYYWDTMRRDVDRFVQNCDTCRR